MNRCVKHFLLGGMIWSFLSTLGYCGMFGIFNKNSTIREPIFISEKNNFNYEFNKYINIKYDETYGFGFSYYFKSKDEKKIIHDFFNTNKNKIHVLIKIYDANNSLIYSVDGNMVPHYISFDNIGVLLVKDYKFLKRGKYNINISISSNLRYPFSNVETNFYVTNGGKGK